MALPMPQSGSIDASILKTLLPMVAQGNAPGRGLEDALRVINPFAPRGPAPVPQDTAPQQKQQDQMPKKAPRDNTPQVPRRPGKPDPGPGLRRGSGIDLPEKEELTNLAALGQGGDTMIAHINPHEAAVLKGMGGSGEKNPATGVTEFDSSTESETNAAERDAENNAPEQGNPGLSGLSQRDMQDMIDRENAARASDTPESRGDFSGLGKSTPAEKSFFQNFLDQFNFGPPSKTGDKISPNIEQQNALFNGIGSLSHHALRGFMENVMGPVGKSINDYFGGNAKAETGPSFSGGPNAFSAPDTFNSGEFSGGSGMGLEGRNDNVNGNPQQQFRDQARGPYFGSGTNPFGGQDNYTYNPPGTPQASAARNQFLNSLSRINDPGWLKGSVGFSTGDELLDSIFNPYEKGAQDYLTRAGNRGMLDQKSLQAALDTLKQQGTAGRGALTRQLNEQGDAFRQPLQARAAELQGQIQSGKFDSTPFSEDFANSLFNDATSQTKQQASNFGAGTSDPFSPTSALYNGLQEGGDIRGSPLYGAIVQNNRSRYNNLTPRGPDRGPGTKGVF